MCWVLLAAELKPFEYPAKTVTVPVATGRALLKSRPTMGSVSWETQLISAFPHIALQ